MHFLSLIYNSFDHIIFEHNILRESKRETNES